jgi:hypothetical protein
MEAGFVQLSRARGSLGIKSDTTDNNNCFLRELDEDTAETAPSVPTSVEAEGSPRSDRP